MMFWKTGKKNVEKRDIEKGSGSETATTSSFGSVSDHGKQHVVVLPPRGAYYPHGSSPTNPTFVNSTTNSNSPGFTSSFPTNEGTISRARTFAERHAFWIIFILLLLLVSILTVSAIFLTRYFVGWSADVSDDQVAATVAATFAPVATGR